MNNRPRWLTRADERAAVRLGFRYRAVRAGDWALLEPVTAIAAERCRLQDDACDFCMQPHAHAVNAYAAGRRSIAVSAGLVTALGRGGITRDQAVAMLSHEVGHLLDHSTRYGLVTAWLTAPWRGANGPGPTAMRDRRGNADCADLVIVPMSFLDAPAEQGFAGGRGRHNPRGRTGACTERK